MHKAYGWAASSFIATVISMQWWPSLPSFAQLAAGVTAISLATILLWRTPRSRKYCLPLMSIGAFLGAIWMASLGHWHQSWQLPVDKIKQNVIVEAQVLKVKTERDIQKLQLYVTSLDGEAVDFRANINWKYPDSAYVDGQRISACVRLKPSRGLQNPGGFDYWKWLVSQRIKAVGYIVQCPSNRLLDVNTQFNQLIKYRLKEIDAVGYKWLLAILLADRTQLNNEDWQLLQRTGIAHLFTLSGLHMGIIFIFCLWLSRLWVFMLFAYDILPSRFNQHKAVYCFALLLSWSFVWLCQYPIPLVRAAIAISLFTLSLIANVRLSPAHLCLWVCVICLLFFPFSIFGLSFYLSFFAVICLLFLMWRFSLGELTFIQKVLFAIKLQWMLSLFMCLASISAFQVVHISSFFINLIAIPFVSFFVVPVGCFGLFLMTLFPRLGQPILGFLGEILHDFMYWLSALPTWSFAITLSLSVIVCLGATFIVLLLPAIRVKLPITLSLVGILFLLNAPGTVENTQSWTLHIFDVGQGSALMVETKNQALLIDTGAQYPNGNSLAESVIVPTLRALKIRKPITGVVTHFDNDHAGGQAWLTEQGIVTTWRSPKQGCVAGQQWQLGSLTVKALWPHKLHQSLSNNNGSCVLLVSDGVTRILIPGDIEKMAEKVLVSQYPQLHTDILIAPHHGSKTSSSLPWVHSVKPKHVVFTNGYLNRWGFPNSIIENRYKAIGAKTYSTAKDGYMRFSIQRQGQSNNRINVHTQRDDLAPRWYKSL